MYLSRARALGRPLGSYANSSRITRRSGQYAGANGRLADIYFNPPADDTATELLGRNAANTSTVWRIDDSGNFFIGLAATGSQPMFTSATSGIYAGVQGQNPVESYVNSRAPENAKIYDQFVDSSGTLHARLFNDVRTSSADWLTLTRSASTPLRLSFGEPIAAPSVNSNLYQGPATAPTGSCTTVGWAFS